MITVLSLNIHKGFSLFNRKFVLAELRQAIREVSADIVFLQEVVGKNELHQEKHGNWPEVPHYEFLADELWPQYAYGKNSVYPAGHHGNAILSKFPVEDVSHINVSASQLEQRGFLYAKLRHPEFGIDIHCGCVHLGLVQRWRQWQIGEISGFLNQRVRPGEPLLVAGDFNDWNGSTDRALEQSLALKEAHFSLRRKHARTYPAWFPLFCLDRIYVRGFSIFGVDIHGGANWRGLSDHVGISAELVLLQQNSEKS